MYRYLDLFIGTYTESSYGGKGKGIYHCRFDRESGALGQPHLAAEAINPSYIACDPTRGRLFCVNELKEYESRPSGAVTAFSVATGTGLLTRLNSRASEGMDPCHIVVDAAGRHVLISNYSSGSLAVLPVGPGGELGEAVQVFRHEGSGADRVRQAGPHVHSLFFDPAERRLFACDLGTDRVAAYSYDAGAGKPLSPAPSPGLSTKPGSGPRHGAFHPSGEYCYLVNELDSTIECLRFRPADSGLERLRTVSALPGSGAEPNLGAAIRVSPDGAFLYVSNRGQDCIVVHRIDRETGLLSFVESASSGGRTPRDFILDPSGAFLFAANQGSDSIVVFRVERESGRLARTGEIGVPTPVCIAAYSPD